MGKKFKNNFIANKIFLKVGNIIGVFNINSLLGVQEVINITISCYSKVYNKAYRII